MENHVLHKFTLYETAGWYYIVGNDITECYYRILKIDRTAEDYQLNLVEDRTIYSQQDMINILDAIDDGNRGTGGIKSLYTTWGLLGFIKFTGPYYMLSITKKSTVAIIGGHHVYKVDGTEMIPLTPARIKPDMRHNVEESRFVSILGNLDLTRSFYYSYSYDITRTLQKNLSWLRTQVTSRDSVFALGDLNSMFVWNNHLLKPAVGTLMFPYDWCRPLIHGYVDQATISVYGRAAIVTILARRSRLFAGARFLKRGANDLGYVANDVETEQIVSDGLTTSFHVPGSRSFSSPRYTAYVQHRGSIPLYWSQDSTGVTPKPPIDLNLVDPFYMAAALHFDDLFHRYGAPLYVLNLVKARERSPRESKLLHEFTNAVEYLNQFLPKHKKIIYRAWDMSRAAKSRDQDVINCLEDIAESVLLATGFFHNGDGGINPIRLQHGIARTNCIDCLDRTNAAQFVIGKRALGYQLHFLGLTSHPVVDYDTDAVNLFTHLYHDLGDTIAVQYGGSQLVNTMETYRKINQWTSQSRDMIESFRRYYNNSFLDGQRQEAYNLFLGNYIFSQGQTLLWDLPNDYYLHHTEPRTRLTQPTKDYRRWYTSTHLVPIEDSLPPLSCNQNVHKPRLPQVRVSSIDDSDFWAEYYRPYMFTPLSKLFPYKMNTTRRYIPYVSRYTTDHWDDVSPFRVRCDNDRESGWEKDKCPPQPRHHNRRLHSHTYEGAYLGSLTVVQGDSRYKFGFSASPISATADDKATTLLHSFTRAVQESLNPIVESHDAADYAQYIAHPQDLAIVSATNLSEIGGEYRDYIQDGWKLPSSSCDISHSPTYSVDFYSEFLQVGDYPLTVVDEDFQKKRYKAYRKWLLGKSLLKHLPADVELRHPVSN
jgi:hypothetical protein